MIGPIQTGTLATAQISARIHSGLAVKLPDGRPGKLAIVDESGAVVDASPAATRWRFGRGRSDIASGRNFQRSANAFAGAAVAERFGSCEALIVEIQRAGAAAG